MPDAVTCTYQANIPGTIDNPKPEPHHQFRNTSMASSPMTPSLPQQPQQPPSPPAMPFFVSSFAPETITLPHRRPHPPRPRTVTSPHHPPPSHHHPASPLAPPNGPKPKRPYPPSLRPRTSPLPIPPPKRKRKRERRGRGDLPPILCLADAGRRRVPEIRPASCPFPLPLVMFAVAVCGSLRRAVLLLFVLLFWPSSTRCDVTM
ncbi:hypothetical protein QBC39DRAFT_360921 [Podospora conica]|nr:hypothetical protein QBC39DRAFT_360921 [Schizothecium conicum]